jgi:hypothetical protein
MRDESYEGMEECTVIKRFESFPSFPNDVITELFLPMGSLVSDIPAADGKLVNLFLRCEKTRELENEELCE